MCRGLDPWFTPQGCYEKVKLWFDENKHVLGTVGMCILIMQVRGPPGAPTSGWGKSPNRAVYCLHSLVCEVCSVPAQ